LHPAIAEGRAFGAQSLGGDLVDRHLLDEFE
jgi:hypothetical protein